MQSTWDNFNTTTAGLRPVEGYRFQKENPYLKECMEGTDIRPRILHLQRTHENVLELEAKVQHDPNNASCWYDLGIRQQSNEREAKAVQALRQCLNLDPSYLPAWLALAVSHTNESNRIETFKAVREWVLRNPDPRYKEVVESRCETGSLRDMNELMALLIEMARVTGGINQERTQVDADVQVALAVLLNTVEDYQRALDCFLTALAVRPEDSVLYNRVGATMANNARADEAIHYYYRALELNPGYIRARYNLGISCINLRHYDEAATHMLDALVLQDSEVSDAAGDVDGEGTNKCSVTSSALWNSLRSTCLHLQRADLASLCDRQDLNGFRAVFHADVPSEQGAEMI